MSIKGSLFGLPVTAGPSESVTKAIFDNARDGGRGYVCVANVHMVITAHKNDRLRRIMEGAFIVTADGLPLAWMLKKQGMKNAERLTGTDLTLRLCKLAQEEKIPVSFYGGSPDTIRQLHHVIKSKYPELIVTDYISPPLLPDVPVLDVNLVRKIESTGARIVFVGLGCPKQEFWMSEYTSHLSAVLIGVGAAFDFIAGTARRAPLWMQRIGLEWFHRLMTQPQKTWKRYLTTNPLFIWLAFKEMIKLKIRKGVLV